MLPGAVALQRFELVAGRNPQAGEFGGGVQLQQLASRDALDVPESRHRDWLWKSASAPEPANVWVMSKRVPFRGTCQTEKASPRSDSIAVGDLPETS
ncbi:MAG: hypothetical protein IT509_13310 [Rhodocyclaceae bacterium]|nr:hypothetical protein [Rhodocyclaceae bacterium]